MLSLISVSVERWCRLRGNLLFYFKSRDHWSEPAGVIVVEDCEVRPLPEAAEAKPLDDSTFGLVLAFSGGHLQHLATYTEAERDSWMAALRSASHRHMRSHLEELRSKLHAKMTSSHPSADHDATFPLVIGEQQSNVNAFVISIRRDHQSRVTHAKQE